MSATLDADWAHTAFDNPTALLPQKRAVAPPRPAQAVPRAPEASRKSDRRYPLHSTDEIENFPPAKYIVKDVLMRNSVAALYGPSGSGKTFLVYSLAFAISDGQEFFGYRIAPCEVLVVSLEGQSGLAQRVQAQRKRGNDGSRIKFTTAPLALNFVDDIDALISTAHDHGIHDGLIILDTLNAAMVGLDENSSSDMGRAVAALKRLRDETGCTVLVIHHSGKDSSKGLRGHSLLHAALDSVIEVTRDGDRRSWKLAKSKDGADGEEHAFRLEVVELGTDDDGDIITSCAVVPEESTGDAMRRTLPPKGGNMKIAWDTIGEAFRKAGDVRPKDAPENLPNNRPCLTYSNAIAAIAPRLTVEPKRRNERAELALTGLVAKKLIMFQDGYLWSL